MVLEQRTEMYQQIISTGDPINHDFNSEFHRPLNFCGQSIQNLPF